jgi:hypothetical protein
LVELPKQIIAEEAGEFKSQGFTILGSINVVPQSLAAVALASKVRMNLGASLYFYKDPLVPVSWWLQSGNTPCIST